MIVSGANIRKIREHKKLTIKELSELAGCGQSYLGEIERGKIQPSRTLIESIANALNVNFRFLLEGSVVTFEDMQLDPITEIGLQTLIKNHQAKIVIGEHTFEIPNELVEPILRKIINYRSQNT